MGRHFTKTAIACRAAVLIEPDQKDILSPAFLQNKIVALEPFARKNKNTRVKKKSSPTRIKPTRRFDQTTSAALTLLSFRIKKGLVRHPSQLKVLSCRTSVKGNNTMRPDNGLCFSTAGLPSGSPLCMAPKLAKHLHLVTKPIDLSLR
mmetsp:Transcript_3446/g.7198  ORF Transcript_3446/g.7198 Transcript_3446/m.7198 type:complete len:148 (+) Transcript_3446:212-655(+)